MKICNHENYEYEEQGRCNESETETAYYCLDCHRNFIEDVDGIIIWESEEDDEYDLTTEEQRVLTEFLGECWHEHATLNTLIWERVVHNCDKCKERMNPSDLPRLDFSDWRAVGRVIEQTRKECLKLYDEQPSVFNTDEVLTEVNDAMNDCNNIPQLAICRAVLAYLKEKE